MPVDPFAVTAKVTSILEHLGISYLLTGSLAATFHGNVRMTRDADLVAQMRAKNVQPFMDALGKEFYLDKEMILDAISRHSSFNLVHRESMFKVDIFIPGMRPYLMEQFARAQKQQISVDRPTKISMATAEDTLLSKLEWYRLGGEVSDIQWNDVLGIIKIQQERLDKTYLQHWAKEIKVSDLLVKAFQEA